jgi:NADH:ubiquinone oxidoreductase subunit 6 (subunit J)
MKTFILEFLAFACIISSILVITSRNPVIAVIYLISVFINAACYLLMLGLGFIGLTYLLLYVGAITILFLFVIMSINIKLTDIMEAGTQYTQNIPLALSIGIFFIYELLSILPNFILSVGASFGSNISLINYPMKAFKWINDQFIYRNSSQNQMEIESLFSDSEQILVNIGEQKIDHLKSLGNGEISQIIEEININKNTENHINIMDLLDKLNDYKTETLNDYYYINALSTSESYNEQIDGILSNLIQLSSLGQELYTHGVSWLMICGIILLLSLLCPTIITRSPKQGD